LNIRISCTETMSCILLHDSSLLRQYILTQPSTNFLHILINQLIEDTEYGIKVEIKDILRTLIDVEQMEDMKQSDKEEFLNYIYSKPMEELINAISETTQIVPHLSARGLICELLAYCIPHHSYRIQAFILRNNVASKVLKLLKHKEVYLVLAAVRFFKSLILLKENVNDFYVRHIIKLNLFDSIVEVFIHNGPRYNLLQSALIELFEHIIKEGMHKVIEYLVDRFHKEFSQIDYVETFKKLILKYEQHKEYTEASKTTNNNSLLPQRRKAVVDEDEDYFNESDDEDKVTPLDSIESMVNGKEEKSKEVESSEFKRRKINSDPEQEDDKKLDNPTKRLKVHK